MKTLTVAVLILIMMGGQLNARPSFGSEQQN